MERGNGGKEGRKEERKEERRKEERENTVIQGKSFKCHHLELVTVSHQHCLSR